MKQRFATPRCRPEESPTKDLGRGRPQPCQETTPFQYPDVASQGLGDSAEQPDPYPIRGMGPLALPRRKAAHGTPSLNNYACPPFARLPTVAISLLAALALASCHMSMTVEEPTLSPLDPSAVRVDLDVDTDRDGVVDDDLDEAGEDAWTPDRGAIFMVNLDNDDANRGGRPDAIDFDVRGAPVSEDFTIDGPRDALDLTELVVRVEGVGAGHIESAVLSVPSLDHVKGVHLFDAIEPGSKSLWGGPGERSASIDLADHLVAGGETTLGIEGLFFRYTEPMAYGGTFEQGYSGELELELTLTGAGGVHLGSDRVMLRVAPLVLLPNTQEAVEMWGRDSSLADFRPFIQDTVALNTYQTGGDQWTQDHVEIGFTHAPGRPKTHVVLQLPRARLTTDGTEDDTPEWPRERLLGPDVGLFRFWNFHIDDGPSAGDLGGNIELMPPTTRWPLGRVLVGDTISPRLLRFLQDQGVQSPFEIDVEWLRVGHVDEALAIVPGGDGWTLVVADPAQARSLLEPLAPDAVFFARGRAAAGLDLKASPGGSDTDLVDSDGTDFRQPEWESMRYVRIYEGTGAGQVAKIASHGKGILTVDKVWQTPARAADMGFRGFRESAADSVSGLIDGISAPPRTRWFEPPDETSRYVFVENALFWLDAVGREVPAVISVHEVRADTLMWALNEEASSRLDEIVSRISQAAGEEINVVRVPDFFMGTFVPDTKVIEDAFAFAPALANLQVAGGRVFFGQGYGPRDASGGDVLQGGFAALMPGPVHAIDGWDRYHRWTGNVHCFTYVKRTPYDFDWWTRLSP